MTGQPHLQGNDAAPAINLVPEHIDVCSTCGYGAVKPNYPCYRCGQLGITRFVPLSVAENLATALEHIAETWKWGNGAGPYAAKALAAYRAAHPREETTG